MTPAALEVAKAVLGGRAVRHGLAAVPDPALSLAPSVPSWAVPEGAGDVLIRPVPYNGGGEVPAWVREGRHPGRVCVSFGLSMLRLNGLALVRTIADAFDDLPGAEAVITLDRARTAELGPVPASVRIIEPAPLSTIMAVSAVACHHGGGGTTLTALTAGLPQLLLPQMMDEHVRCERVAGAGAGITIGDAAGQNDPARVRDALHELLVDDAYGRAARDAQDELDALPSPADIALRLENLAGVPVPAP
jgi:UDP:flavonoid glycosyltransferase YjiC (YdhE family)